MATIEVRNPETEALILSFRAPKDAQAVLETMQDKTGQRGVLQSKKMDLGSVAYIASDSMTGGTYYWHVAGNGEDKKGQPQASSGSDAPRSRQLAAAFVALLVLGGVVQLAILGIALPFCDHNWHCAHGWYKAFISHIDGPFKILTFWAAIRAARAHPDRWLNRIGYGWWFAGRGGQAKTGGSGVQGRRKTEDGEDSTVVAGDGNATELNPRKESEGLEQRKGFKRTEAESS